MDYSFVDRIVGEDQVRRAAYEAIDKCLKEMFKRKLLHNGEPFEVSIEQFESKPHPNYPGQEVVELKQITVELIQLDTGAYEQEEVTLKTTLQVEGDSPIITSEIITD